MNGQWFKGRIYERRSDLSPDGTKLLYFAQKINRQTVNDKEYSYAWTAISSPPNFTASALWAKGDCWHGGGLFRDNKTVLLNHKPEVAKAHPKHLPKGLNVIPDPKAHGEDEPIYSRRLDRDGWRIVQQWIFDRVGSTTLLPEIREKTVKSSIKTIMLERRFDQTKSTFRYTEKFSLKNNDEVILEVSESGGWIDFDQNGRISVFKDGKLFAEQNKAGINFELIEIADFNQNKPENTRSRESVTH